MELRHLRYFTAVARELNFSRAAEMLHMAQPPLSRQIRQLEDELGAELLDRSSRPLRLTQAGQFFQGQAQQVLDRLSEVRGATARIAQGRRAWFSIGFVPSTLYGMLPDVIRQFREALPNVEVGLSELTTLQQIEALKTGRIDVGFGRLRFDDDRIAGEVISEERVIAALPIGHAFSRHKRLSLEELEQEPLILYPGKPRPSYADQVLDMFRTRGLSPNVVLEANEMQTTIGLVAAGIGYALVPQTVQALHRKELAYVPLSDAEVSSMVIMNCRAGDDSDLLGRMRELVRASTFRSPAG